MNNQSNDNELQKAIDDITKGGGASATSGDAVSELEAKIQNQMGTPPVPTIPAEPTAPEPTVSTGPVKLEPLGSSAPADDSASDDGGADTTLQIHGEPEASEEPKEEEPPIPASTESPIPAPKMANTPLFTNKFKSNGGITTMNDLGQVKDAMLQDLVPLMDKLDIAPEQKWRFYYEVIQKTGDKGLVAPSYGVVKDITDEKVKADALLYLLNLVEQ